MPRAWVTPARDKRAAPAVLAGQSEQLSPTAGVTSISRPSPPQGTRQGPAGTAEGTAEGRLPAGRGRDLSPGRPTVSPAPQPSSIPLPAGRRCDSPWGCRGCPAGPGRDEPGPAPARSAFEDEPSCGHSPSSHPGLPAGLHLLPPQPQPRAGGPALRDRARGTHAWAGVSTGTPGSLSSHSAISPCVPQFPPSAEGRVPHPLLQGAAPFAPAEGGAAPGSPHPRQRSSPRRLPGARSPLGGSRDRGDTAGRRGRILPAGAGATSSAGAKVFPCTRKQISSAQNPFPQGGSVFPQENLPVTPQDAPFHPALLPLVSFIDPQGAAPTPPHHPSPSEPIN